MLSAIAKRLWYLGETLTEPTPIFEPETPKETLWADVNSEEKL